MTTAVWPQNEAFGREGFVSIEAYLETEEGIPVAGFEALARTMVAIADYVHLTAGALVGEGPPEEAVLDELLLVSVESGSGKLKGVARWLGSPVTGNLLAAAMLALMLTGGEGESKPPPGSQDQIKDTQRCMAESLVRSHAYRLRIRVWNGKDNVFEYELEEEDAVDFLRLGNGG